MQLQLRTTSSSGLELIPTYNGDLLYWNRGVETQQSEKQGVYANRSEVSQEQVK